VRKRKYHAPQVRRLQDQGYKPKEIAALLKITPHAVHQIRYRDKLRAEGKPINDKRPAKPKTFLERLKWWAK
jgi:predicted transcriptional regulator